MCDAFVVDTVALPSPKFQVYVGVVPVLLLVNVKALPLKHCVALLIAKLANGTVQVTGAGVTVTTVFLEAEPQVLVTVYVIVALPTATPVTTPDVGFTVATLVLALDHTPPELALVSVVVEPTCTDVAPFITDGCAGTSFTVTVFITVFVPQLLVAVRVTE